MAVSDVKTLVDTFGVAVRAGLLTPTLDDEKYIRELLGFPDVTSEVVALWSESNNVRLPVTLQTGKPAGGSAAPPEGDPPADT